MNIKELHKKQKELKKKIKNVERAQGRGRYRSEYYKLERERHRQIINKNLFKKNIRSRHEKAIKRSIRSQKAYKSYQKRVAKGTDYLSKISVAQRKEYAKKAAQTRAENRAKKAEGEGLTHGEKIRRGKIEAALRREKRSLAGKKAWQSRQDRINREIEEFFKILIGHEEDKFDRDVESAERNEENEKNNDIEYLAELADVFLKYGQFAHESTRQKLSQNMEFQRQLSLKLAEKEKNIRSFLGETRESVVVNRAKSDGVLSKLIKEGLRDESDYLSELEQQFREFSSGFDSISKQYKREDIESLRSLYKALQDIAKSAGRDLNKSGSYKRVKAKYKK